MNKIEKMLQELSLHFTNYMHGDDQAVAWARSWAIAFKNTEPWLLEAATQRIVETREERKHPLISDMRRAIQELQEIERRNNPKMAVAVEQQHGDQFALADALINCEMGREAARAEPCWVLALHDFCRENRRLPTGGEIAKLKRVAAEFEDRYRACVRKEIGSFNGVALSGPLEKLGASMIRRREQLRAKLIGRAAA